MGRGKFQLGEYKLVQRDGSPIWYRETYDAGSRKVSRISMKTPDFEIAKERLRDWYYDNHRLNGDNLDPRNVLLADVLQDYEHNHAVKLASAKTVTILLRYWSEWWGEASVADVRSVVKQEEFLEHLQSKGLALNSVNRVMEIGQAAIRRAWKRGVISSHPHIHKLQRQEDKPRGRELEIDELRAWLQGSDEPHWRDFMIIMLGTACRNGAALQLTKEQIDFERGRVMLNPPGRRQTSKRRPVVRLPDPMAERFKSYPAGRLMIFHGRPVGKIDHIARLARKRAGLDMAVTPYSLRHTAARWLRREGVPLEQVSAQMGHKDLGYNMTLRYAPDDPAYQNEACAALEKLLRLVL